VGIWNGRKRRTHTHTRRPKKTVILYIYNNNNINIIIYDLYRCRHRNVEGTTRRVCRVGGGWMVRRGIRRRRRDKNRNDAHVVAVAVADRRRTVRQTYRQTLTAGHLVPAAARAHPPGTVSSCGTPRARCTKPCLYTGRALYI